MFVVEFAANRFELTRLEDAHVDAAPALGAADQGRVH